VPDPAGELTALPRPYSCTGKWKAKGKEGKERGEEGEMENKGEWRGREGEGNKRKEGDERVVEGEIFLLLSLFPGN